MRELATVLRPLLEGPSRWHTVEHHEVLGSTNDVARQALERGAPPGLVVVADRQTSGRGRRGRTWEDRAHGASLLVSVTLAPPAAVTLVPLAAGLAVVDAVGEAGVVAGLKWPNDVLVAGPDGPRKLAGILAEARPEGVVLGIGVNVDLRDESVDGATSIADVQGTDIDRWDVLAGMLRALERWLQVLDVDDRPGVLTAYRERCVTLGADVVAELSAGGPVHGRAVDVSPTGALVVVTGDGRRHEVSAGDVHHLRPRGARDRCVSREPDL